MSESLTTTHSAEDKTRHNTTSHRSPFKPEIHLEVEKVAASSMASDFHLANPFATTAEDPSPSRESFYSTETSNPSSAEQTEPTSLATGFIKAALDDDLDEASDLVAIEFTISPLIGRRYLPIPAVVSMFDTVYAQISPFQRCITCIVKWQQPGSEEVDILALATLSPNQLHTVFVTPENGWKKGQYVMSVYDASQSNHLLGRNSIFISDVLVETLASVPDSEFIQSLLDRGQAASKTITFPSSTSEAENAIPNYQYIQSLLNSGEAVVKSN